MFILNLMQEVSRLIGVGLSKLLGWRIDLKTPELEVGDFFFNLILFETSICMDQLFYPECFLLFFRLTLI